MPQLNLDAMGQGPGTRFVIEYWSNPLHPGDYPNIEVKLQNNKGESVMSLFATIPHDVVWEMVHEIMDKCWSAWLFSTPEDVKIGFNRAAKMWRKEAAERRDLTAGWG